MEIVAEFTISSINFFWIASGRSRVVVGAYPHICEQYSKTYLQNIESMQFRARNPNFWASELAKAS